MRASGGHAHLGLACDGDIMIKENQLPYGKYSAGRCSTEADFAVAEWRDESKVVFDAGGMEMDAMQVPMTDSLKSFVQNQASKRGFPSPGDYVQSVLLDLERREKDKKELEGKLLDGARSPMIEADEAFWRELEQELFDQYPELKSCPK